MGSRDDEPDDSKLSSWAGGFRGLGMRVIASRGISAPLWEKENEMWEGS